MDIRLIFQNYLKDVITMGRRRRIGIRAMEMRGRHVGECPGKSGRS